MACASPGGRQNDELLRDDEVQLAKAFVVLNPGDARYLNNLAITLAGRGYVPDAAQALHQALAESSRWKEQDRKTREAAYKAVFMNLGLCYKSFGLNKLSDEAKAIARTN